MYIIFWKNGSQQRHRREHVGSDPDDVVILRMKSPYAIRKHGLKVANRIAVPPRHVPEEQCAVDANLVITINFIMMSWNKKTLN